MSFKPLTNTQKVMLGSSKPVVLLFGDTPEGVPFFAYVKMTKEDYARLIENPDSFDKPESHGEVIIKGEGRPPTGEQVKYMEKYFKFDHQQVAWDDFMDLFKKT